MELDNPIWTALTTRQAALALGSGPAKRYPPEVTLLSALEAPARPALEALLTLLGPDEHAVLFLDAPLSELAESVVETDRVSQMVCRAPPTPAATEVSTLGPADLPQMLALAAQTQPGPFGPRTPELGHYIGVHQSGKLAAMAGERMRLPGFTEVSAVCSAPELRGRGLASALVASLTREIHARGETAMLHVRSRNQAAIRVYEKLGFVIRREFHMAVVAAQR